MLSRLLTWLDQSGTHYWTVAWVTFGLVVALAVVTALFPSPRRWWHHPGCFGALSLLAILAFRWPVLVYNSQLADPDESQLIAGALTLSQDPVYWRSVDGTTHGPLADAPLLLPRLVGAPLDFTSARGVSVLLAWVTVLAAASIFRSRVGEGWARLLVLPLLATFAFTHNWYFAQYGSEHAPAALLALGCALLLTATPAAGRPRHRQLFLAGLLLGLVPFGKLQLAPMALWAATSAAAWVGFLSGEEARHRRRALAALATGAVTGPALLVGLVVATGSGPDFWDSYLVNNLQYAGSRWFTWRETPAKFLELSEVAEGFSPFFFWVVGISAFGFLGWRRFDAWYRWATLFTAGLLLSAWYATMAPGRMFMHYVQLLMFPAGLFGGMMGSALLQAETRFTSDTSRRMGCGAWLMVVVLAAGLAPQILWRAQTDFPLRNYYSVTHGALAQSEVAREILRHARPGERMAIWGWMPTYWVETGLVQGTRDGNCARQLEPTPVRDRYRARFLADLRRLAPPVFVDAVGGDNFSYQDRTAHGHENFAELRDYVGAQYRSAADVGGARIYVRRDRPAEATPRKN